MVNAKVVHHYLFPPLQSQGYYNAGKYAGDEQIGWFLPQEEQGRRNRPIKYLSRSSKDAERAYDRALHGFLAGVWAVLMFRTYLQRCQVTLWTDDETLKWIVNITVYIGNWCVGYYHYRRQSLMSPTGPVQKIKLQARYCFWNLPEPIKRWSKMVHQYCTSQQLSAHEEVRQGMWKCKTTTHLPTRGYLVTYRIRFWDINRCLTGQAPDYSARIYTGTGKGFLLVSSIMYNWATVWTFHYDRNGFSARTLPSDRVGKKLFLRLLSHISYTTCIILHWWDMLMKYMYTIQRNGNGIGQHGKVRLNEQEICVD